MNGVARREKRGQTEAQSVEKRRKRQGLEPAERGGRVHRAV
jgi:hypothetical protein